MTYRLTLPLTCLALLALAGCGDPRGPVAEVSGSVTIDGKPVTAGTVLFVSEDGRRMATAPLSPTGTYRLRDAPVGELRIAVQTLIYSPARRKAAPAKLPPGHSGSLPGVVEGPADVGTVYVAIPEKYEAHESTPLRYTVEVGSHTHNVALTWK